MESQTLSKIIESLNLAHLIMLIKFSELGMKSVLENPYFKVLYESFDPEFEKID